MNAKAKPDLVSQGEICRKFDLTDVCRLEVALHTVQYLQEDFDVQEIYKEIYYDLIEDPWYSGYEIDSELYSQVNRCQTLMQKIQLGDEKMNALLPPLETLWRAHKTYPTLVVARYRSSMSEFNGLMRVTLMPVESLDGPTITAEIEGLQNRVRRLLAGDPTILAPAGCWVAEQLDGPRHTEVRFCEPCQTTHMSLRPEPEPRNHYKTGILTVTSNIWTSVHGQLLPC